jgi:hypothetical protein
MSTPTIPPALMTAPAGGSYAKNAIITQQNNVAKQSAMLQTTGGKGHRNRRGGATATVPKMIFVPSPVNGTPNSTQNLANRGGQAGLQATQGGGFDGCAGQGPSCTAAVIASQAGGKRRSKKWGRMSGGKSHSVNWGCMSGGKKRRTKKSIKSKKSRKQQKSRKHRK